MKKKTTPKEPQSISFHLVSLKLNHMIIDLIIHTHSRAHTRSLIHKFGEI